MKRKLLLLILLALSLFTIAKADAQGESGELTVMAARLTDEAKENLLVSCGIPFAPGQIFSDKNIAFYHQDGTEIPIATKILAYWPKDNSLRSVLVQFVTQIPKKYHPVIMRWGKPRTTLEQKLIEPSWVMPEAIVVLPAEWLCSSLVTGLQVPMQFDRFSGAPTNGYDQRAVDYFTRVKEQTRITDIRKDFYYDTAHTFYQIYCRAADEGYFKFARRLALEYRDKEIIQSGPERGRHIKYKQTRYIYVEAMADDYLLTGDPKSLEVAGYMAEYLKNNYDPSKAFFPKNAKHFWTEREVAFPLIGMTTYYELTGKKEYLEIVGQVVNNLYRTQLEWPQRGGFIHNLYSHDPEEGARQNEYGGSPFMTGLLLEGIVKYHQLTGSETAKDSIFKALDWLMKEAFAPDGTSFVYTTAEVNKNEGHPDLNLLIVHAFGYGYKISGFSRNNYLETGLRIFKRGVDDANLGNGKHFNQNYRSSGHFLAYIKKLPGAVIR